VIRYVRPVFLLFAAGALLPAQPRIEPLRDPVTGRKVTRYASVPFTSQESGRLNLYVVDTASDLCNNLFQRASPC
jgi:hypothetical protein